MNRNTWAAIVATIVVVTVVILGMRVLGGPATQRLVQSDLIKLRTLGGLAQEIKFAWDRSGKALPVDLEKFSSSVKQDPVTNKFFTYRPKANSAYELCATFSTDSHNLHVDNMNDFWDHPKGDYCFQLDASQPVPQVPYYY